jgi:hypothetical protein
MPGARPVLAGAAAAIMRALAALYVVAAITGCIASYSPVPFWDMWEGYIGFFLGLEERGWQAWWAQHNEHRIVLGRLLFWIDINLFGGNFLFLLVSNFLFAGIAALLFSRMIRDATADADAVAQRRLAAPVVVCLMFSWVQSENFTWGFQGAFFLAQLIPLAAMYCLYLHSAARVRNGLFIAAALLGVASALTMANGILTLPLLVMLALFFRLDRSRVGLLLALAIATLAFYFLDFHAVGHHGSVLDAIVGQPLALLQYVLLYLGGPFDVLSAGGSLWAAQAAGAIFMLGTAFLLIRIWRAPAVDALSQTLLVFIGYILATAFGTGAGRIVFGVEQALASRYTTPALMAWCALLAACMQVFRHSARGRRVVVTLGALAAATLLPLQLSALNAQPVDPFERLIAGLALEMGIRDSQQIRHVAPRLDTALDLADAARQRGLSVFGNPLLRGMREDIGRRQLPALPDAARCVARIDTVNPLPGERRYLAIGGWIYRADTDDIPRTILFSDSAGTLIGYGFSGGRRCDITEARGSHPGQCNVGFKGYLLAAYAGAPVSVFGEQPDCR